MSKPFPSNFIKSALSIINEAIEMHSRNIMESINQFFSFNRQNIYMTKSFTVYAELDEETGRWTAYSDDIPGLVLEVADMEELDREINYVVPELLALNHATVKEKSVPVNIKSIQNTRQLSVAVA